MSTIHLNHLINPASIALIGASARENSPGLAVARNLLAGNYRGELYFVNPRYKEVLGKICHRSLKNLAQAPELAIILAPERVIRRTLVQCSRYGVAVALVMSAVKDSSKLHAFARKLGIRLLGPFCAGIIRPHLQLNASYSANRITPGSLAIVSQSASLGGAILDWAETSGVGFSALMSTGADTDITLADLLDLLAEDPHTKAIIVYLDRISNARSFLSAISAAARIKPVVLMRSTQDTARYCDAIARSDQIFSSDHVIQAALSRAGVVRIRTFSNLFAAAKILSSGVRTRGKRLAIVSNGAAPAMMACERIEAKGFLLPGLPEDLSIELDKAIEGQWSQTTPIVLRKPEALAENYRRVIELLQTSSVFDAVLIIFVPNSRNHPDTIAEAVTSCMPSRIPLLTCWMGDSSVQRSREFFTDARIATFRTPEAATDGFDFLYRYHVSQQLLLQLPNPTSRDTPADIDSAKKLVSDALATGERVLGPQKTRALLSFFDIDVLEGHRVTSVTQAVAAANTLGYPIALKLVSPNIAFKASVVGAQLNIQNDIQLSAAYENIETQLRKLRPDAEFRGVLVEPMHTPSNYRSLAIGLNRDSSFGPVLSVSIGGDLTALIHGRSVQLPPLNRFLIDNMLANREINTYLGDFRHLKAIGNSGVSHVLRRLSELACELPNVYSVNINPLRISQDRAVAMEVQVVIERVRPQHRYGHLAIHPYPWQWIRDVSLKNDNKMQLRPIRPEDADSIAKLVKEMSAESRYFRFMHAINELSPQMLALFTKLDYDRQMAFVATTTDNVIVGITQYTISNDRLSGEFAVSIADKWQGIGLATSLMKLLIEHATVQELETIFGDVLRTNKAMQALMQTLGFKGAPLPDENDVLRYTFTLPAITAKQWLASKISS